MESCISFAWVRLRTRRAAASTNQQAAPRSSSRTHCSASGSSVPEGTYPPHSGTSRDPQKCCRIRLSIFRRPASQIRFVRIDAVAHRRRTAGCACGDSVAISARRFQGRRRQFADTGIAGIDAGRRCLEHDARGRRHREEQRRQCPEKQCERGCGGRPRARERCRARYRDVDSIHCGRLAEDRRGRADGDRDAGHDLQRRQFADDRLLPGRHSADAAVRRAERQGRDIARAL